MDCGIIYYVEFGNYEMYRLESWFYIFYCVIVVFWYWFFVVFIVLGVKYVLSIGRYYDVVEKLV